jgi:hypothetical protein
MVVIVRSFGNHSNRLFQNLHIEAFCIEHKIPFFNATMFDMARLFRFKYNYFLAISIIVFFKVTKYFKLIHYIEFSDIHQLEYYKQNLLLGRSGLLFVGGWEFRDYEAISNQFELLKNKYCIIKSNKSFSLICDKIKDYEIVLGVHIRRGDFKTWCGGKYYFDDSTYRRFVNDFIKIQNGKKIFVIYFSDNKLDPSSLNCPTEYIISKNAYYIDYKLMGKCTYLIGPPSTFSPWASFLYNVPYLRIEDSQQELHLADFKICRG